MRIFFQGVRVRNIHQTGLQSMPDIHHSLIHSHTHTEGGFSLTLTWKPLCWSTPQRPGGNPGSSNTVPSGGESSTCRPLSIHFLQNSESVHIRMRRTHVFQQVFHVWGVTWYYQVPPIGRALPFPPTASFRQSTLVACWSRWNRSTYTSFPITEERTLKGSSESKVCVCECVQVRLYQHWYRQPDWTGSLVAPGFTDSKLLRGWGLPCYLLLEHGNISIYPR